MQLEVNYMLIGVFDILVAKQQEYDAYAGYLEAVQDYWTARTALTRAVGQRLPSSQQQVKATLDPKELTKPKGGGGMSHGQHGGSMGGMSMPMGDMPGMDMQDSGGPPKDMPPMKGMESKGNQTMPAPRSQSSKPPAAHDMKSMPMDDMPGMDMSAPKSRAPAKPQGGHAMPDMQHDSPPKSDPKQAPEQPAIQEERHAH